MTKEKVSIKSSISILYKPKTDDIPSTTTIEYDPFCYPKFANPCKCNYSNNSNDDHHHLR